MLFRGLAIPDDGFADYYARMQALTEHLPSAVFVLAAQDVAFAEVLF